VEITLEKKKKKNKWVTQINVHLTVLSTDARTKLFTILPWTRVLVEIPSETGSFLYSCYFPYIIFKVYF